MKKILFSGILILLFTFPMEAQILKKLKKGIEKSVENTIVNKVSDKAASETEKSMDKMLDFQLDKSGFPMGLEQADLSEVPEVYDFDWSYIMEMDTKERKMEMKYFLKKDAPYFGIEMAEAGGIFIVMDPSRELTVMYINSGGNKMLRATSTAVNKEGETSMPEGNMEDYSFKQVDSKKILGYNCSGYQAENKDNIITFYVTTEPGVSFTDIYKSNKSNLPSGFDPEWLEEKNALMMQMIMEDKKNSKDNFEMTCIDLKPQDFSISKSEYNSIAGN